MLVLFLKLGHLPFLSVLLLGRAEKEQYVGLLAAGLSSPLVGEHRRQLIDPTAPLGNGPDMRFGDETRVATKYNIPIIPV